MSVHAPAGLGVPRGGVGSALQCRLCIARTPPPLPRFTLTGSRRDPCRPLRRHYRRPTPRGWRPAASSSLSSRALAGRRCLPRPSFPPTCSQRALQPRCESPCGGSPFGSAGRTGRRRCLAPPTPFPAVRLTAAPRWESCPGSSPPSRTRWRGMCCPSGSSSSCFDRHAAATLRPPSHPHLEVHSHPRIPAPPQDFLLAALSRNFFLAQRVFGDLGRTPLMNPSMPDVRRHPLWAVRAPPPRLFAACPRALIRRSWCPFLAALPRRRGI